MATLGGDESVSAKTNPIPQSILIGKGGGLRLRHVGRDGAEDLVVALSNHIDERLAE